MAEGQMCRHCGCSDYSACVGGCWWVEDPEGLGSLCSNCRDELYPDADKGGSE